VSDAYGSIPLEAILEGNHLSLGAYNSCNDLDENGVIGQYCSVLAAPNIPENPQAEVNFSPLITGGQVDLNVRISLINCF